MEFQVSDDLLLDFHLDRLDAPRKQMLEERLRQDAQLRQRSSRIGRVLRPLDHWSVNAVPPELVDRILFASKTQVIPASSAAVSAAPTPSASRRFVPLRDFLAVAACLVLLFSVMIPGLSQARSMSRRVLCTKNLSSIYEATGMYRVESHESLPYAGHEPGASWLPDGPPSAAFASNSRHVFQLLRSDFGLSPVSFVCPFNETAEVMSEQEVHRLDDFASSRNISFDSLNLAGPRPNLRPPVAIAYLSDRNPLFVGGRFNSMVDPESNSPAHGGHGQSVLMLDGNVQVLTSPVYAKPKKDNIWVAEDVRYYTGHETQTQPDDAFLIPGFPVSKP